MSDCETGRDIELDNQRMNMAITGKSETTEQNGAKMQQLKHTKKKRERMNWVGVRRFFGFYFNILPFS